MIYYLSLIRDNKYSLKLKYLTYFLQIFLLSLILLSCRAVDEELVISVSEDVIGEYAMNPNNSNLAVVVPVGEYFPELGGMDSRIRILDMDSKETIAQLPESSNSHFVIGNQARRLNWITDTELMFFLSDEMMVWNIATEKATVFPIPYGGYSTSHQTHEIASWQLSNDRNFASTVDIDIYTYPDGLKSKSFSIIGDTEIEIVDVVWSLDDKSLLVIATLRADKGYIYQIDLLTGNVEKLATVDSLLLPSDEIAWNSINNWIAISRAGNIKLFSLVEECFFEEYPGQYREPLWTNSSLFVLKRPQIIVELSSQSLANDQVQCLSSQ